MRTPDRGRSKPSVLVDIRAAVAGGAWLLVAAPLASAIPAFPGAEGPGADATGGRASDVYHVTNLQDDHDGTIPGSLRYGLVNAPAAGRTIVFDVGGTIRLVLDVHNSTHTWLRSGKANITLAGQTAPGNGITIIGQGATLSGDNWILRNVKFRPGQDQRRPGILTNDGISNKLQNSIIDHVSVSWADDEALSSTDAVNNTTVQYSILGEGLNYTLNDGSNHAFGALISSEVNDARLSYHHNLFIHLSSRNPRLGSENGTGAVTSFTNNVVYNWRGRAGYSINGKPSRTNYLGNTYIAGNNTLATDRVFFSPDANTRIYHGNTNAVDMNKNGTLDAAAFNFTGPQFQGMYTQEASPFDVPSGYVQSAADAVPQVLDHAGAMWWNRDPIDERLVSNARNGTGSIINHINDAPKDPNYQYDATGFPIYPEVHRPADFDADQDGMADAWEHAHGLDTGVADNAGDFDGDGYTNLEEYLNDLGAFPAPTAIRWQGGDGRYALIGNWGISQTIPVNTVTNWQPSRFDEARIDSGVVTVDSVGQHARVLTIAHAPGSSAELRITDGWLKAAEAIVIGGTAGAEGALVLSGGVLTTPVLAKSDASTFSFIGGTLHAGVVTFDLVNDGGTLSLGNSIGHTHVQGDLTLNDGELEIELAEGGLADTLLVDGLLSLGGDLSVRLLDGYAPAAGSRWTIIAAADFTGAFDSITPGFATERDGDFLVLVAVPEPATALLGVTASLLLISKRVRHRS